MHIDFMNKVSFQKLNMYFYLYSIISFPWALQYDDYYQAI